MRLKVTNLGKIKTADIEIKPLTVFVGPNNTNKTWTAYALYGLLSRISRTHSVDFLLRDGVRAPVFFVDADERLAIKEKSAFILTKILANPESSISFSLDRTDLSQLLRGDLKYSLTPNRLGELLAVSPGELVNTSAELLVSEDELKFPAFSKAIIAFDSKQGLMTWRLSSLESDHQDPPIEQAVDVGQIYLGRTLDQVSLSFLIEEIVKRLMFCVVGTSIVMPAERKTLVAISQTLPQRSLFAERSQAVFAAPISDYMDMIYACEYKTRDPDTKEGPYALVADRFLEGQILEGSLSFKKEEGEHSAEFENTTPLRAFVRRVSRERGFLTYSTSGNDHNWGIQATSSMVKSLAGLDLFLRYLCDEKSVIIIDEPEMNAHPEAQLKLIELFAILANSGVKVIITTHSPYIVDHLNNLTTAARLPQDTQDRVAKKFKLQDRSAFLSADKVSAYLFNENGTVEDIMDKDEGLIGLRTFGRETEFLMNLYSDLLDDLYPDPEQVVEASSDATS